MKILTLSTYPIKTPEHGGQHRMRNIVDAFVKAGHSVQSCGVLGSPSYPHEKGFVPFPGVEQLKRFLPDPTLMEDWAIGRLFRTEERFFGQLSGLIDGVPDVIHCEQPWLFGFALKYAQANSRKKKIKIIYGSANVECDLKFSIVKNWMGKDIAELYKPLIFECEKEAILASDMVACVSEHDAAWTSRFNPAGCFIAANGVVDRRAAIEDVRSANQLTGGRKFALFCASAHPPNMVGFFDIFKNGAGCFPPNSRLVTAGSVGHAVLNSPQFSQCAGLGPVFLDAGRVSESLLTGLIKTAHVVILPITQGGGTNLKAAEAIWSGKHVVATSKAMRGFEEFSNSPGIRVADNPSQFLQAICDAMQARPHSIGRDDCIKRASVLWDSTLEPLLKAVSRLGA